MLRGTDQRSDNLEQPLTSSDTSAPKGILDKSIKNECSESRYIHRRGIVNLDQPGDDRITSDHGCDTDSNTRSESGSKKDSGPISMGRSSAKSGSHGVEGILARVLARVCIACVRAIERNRSGCAPAMARPAGECFLNNFFGSQVDEISPRGNTSSRRRISANDSPQAQLGRTGSSNRRSLK